ncbi:MAG: ankyrin repeat domain-containing protein [Deltaproteobacteria bacterium]|nr:ankyrin repeat domain-containing protein [Deltaproteobacteria bacterium]
MDEKVKKLHDAIADGREDEAKALIVAGTNFHTRPPGAFSDAFGAAISEGLVELVESMLAQGADINAPYCSKNWGSPLHLAIIKGREVVVRLLLDHGADMHARNAEWEQSPLHVACARDMHWLVELLIEQGAAVDTRDYENNTPLHETHDVDIARLLVSEGADIRALNDDGLTPLQCALHSGSACLARFLIEQGSDLQHLSKERGSLLHSACSGQDPDLVRYLLEAGLDASALSGGGWTPLHYCVVGNFTEAMLLLLERGAAVDAPNEEGHTSLHIAAKYCAVAAARTLLECGANVNAFDGANRETDAQTPLSLVIDGKQSYELDKSSLDFARVLLDHGAEVTAKQHKVISQLQRKVTRLREKIAAHDWGKLEDRIVRLFTKVVVRVAKDHPDEVFCAFALDCHAQEGGQMLACFNTQQNLDSYQRKREVSGDDLERWKWNPGNWDYSEMATTIGSKGWSSAMRGISIDGGIELPAAEKLLEAACGAMLRMAREGAFVSLSRAKEFQLLVCNHNEPLSAARERMARVRGSS